MPAPTRARARRGIPDRSVPRVLAVAATLAGIVGLVAVLLGSYVISGHDLTAQPGPTLAVPVGGAGSSSDATSATPTPSPSTTTPAAGTTPATTPAAPRTTAKVTAKGATTARTSTAPTTTAPAGSLSSSTAAAGGISTMEQAVLTLTNAQRTAKGCPALAWNATLAVVARAHSQDMATSNYFDHNSLDGTTPAQRVQAAGYAYIQTAENIAAGQATPDAVMTSWMGSPGHAANILNCALTELGVGVAAGGSYGTYWTQDFGTR